MGHPVTLVRGDGVGPDITEATRLVINATGVSIDWQVVDAGKDAIAQYGTPLPEHVLATIRETKTVLKGPTTTPVDLGFPSIDGEICKQLNLYAHLRPAQSMVGMKSPFENIDLVIIRENTEDLVAAIEFERTTMEAAESREFLSRLSGKKIRDDGAIGVKWISVMGSHRIAEFAFKHATVCGRRKVTAVHKANYLNYTDGLFLEIMREVAKEYPHIEFEDCTVDHLCLRLMQQPTHYDVLVMPNLYGDIVSNLCAGMIGGLGVAPSANVGDECAVFGAIHDSTPEYTGENKANPTALIRSGILMLQHLKEVDAAKRLQAAVEKVIAEQKSVTADLAPEGISPVGTREMAEAIAAAL